jgi:hypothetical protein
MAGRERNEMTKTTYTCDRCGKGVDRGELFNVEIIVENAHYYVRREAKQWKEWCKQCITDSGLVVYEKLKDPEVTPPSFEDLVREIIREEIQNQ